MYLVFNKNGECIATSDYPLNTDDLATRQELAIETDEDFVNPHYDGKAIIERGLQPSIYHVWSDKGWVLDEAQQAIQFKDAKAAKLNAATEKAQAIINEVAGVNSLPDFEVQSWATQADEAQAWAKDNSAHTPILSAIAQARGVPVDVLRQKALEKAQAYALLTATIAGQRQRFEDAIKAATNLDALEAINISYQLPQAAK